MITQDSVLVQLMRLIDRIPSPLPGLPRGRPKFYPEKLFLKALVIMIVRRLNRVGELLAVLDEPTPEMRMVRELLSEKGRFPSRRTFERRLKALPRRTLPEQIGCAWDVIWWSCFDHGRRQQERSPWTAHLLEPKVECATRKTKGSGSLYVVQAVQIVVVQEHQQANFVHGLALRE